MKNKTILDTCYTRKGTREFYRVTHLGALDRPMGLIFCTDKHHRALATAVNFNLEQLVKITREKFNREWVAFVLGLANENVPVPIPQKKKRRRGGKINRNWP